MKMLATVCVSFFLILGWQLHGDVPTLAAKPANVEQERLHKLIAQLGSDSFAAREQASRELEAAGPLALDALRAAVKHQDAEISGRAARLVAFLDEQALTGKMLAGKKVRLVVQDVSVVEAVNALAKLSGYRLDLTGNLTAQSERKITLDTGEVTFWEALQQLCQKGGLTETPFVNQPTYKTGKVGKGLQPTYISSSYLQPRTSIQLTDGDAKQIPVCFQGSVRIQALPGEKAGLGEMQFLLDVSGETRLQEFGIVGTPFLSKIVDDRGKLLTTMEPEADPDQFGTNTVRFGGLGNGNGIMIVNGNVVQPGGTVLPAQRSVAVRVKLGEKGTKRLKEVSGTVSVQALNAPEVLVKVDRVLQAAGQSFVGKGGNAIHVQTVDKLDDGSYRIHLGLENPGLQVDPFVIRNVRGRGLFNNNLGIPYSGSTNMPKLIDAQGKEHLAEVVSQGVTLNANSPVVLNAILDYRPTAAPAQLMLHGQRLVLFTVPFTLKNVPVP